MLTEPVVTRIVWRHGDHVVVHYDDGAIEVVSGTRQFAADLADQQGLFSVRAPWDRSEWRGDPDDSPAGNQIGASPSIDVVVVDDDIDVGASTAEVLRSEGLRVALAATVGEARELLETSHVRCLIFDHTLVVGETNWTEIANGIPIILTSGVASDQMDALHKRYGERLFACMSKPMQPTDLIDSVRGAIEWTR